MWNYKNLLSSHICNEIHSSYITEIRKKTEQNFLRLLNLAGGVQYAHVDLLSNI